MLIEKCQNIFIVLMILSALFYIFGGPVWFSEWLVKFLAHSLLDKVWSREQEWLACLDELPTPRAKAFYAVSLVLATVILILSPPSSDTCQVSIKDFFPPPKGFYPEPIRAYKAEPYLIRTKKPTRWSMYCDRLYLGQSSVDYVIELDSEEERLRLYCNDSQKEVNSSDS